MTSTRTALFPSAFHPHLGGVEELTKRLALEQRRRNRDPIVVTMLEPKSLPGEDRLEGVPVSRHRFRVPEPHPRYLLGWAVHASQTRSAVVRRLQDHKADLVHVQCVSNNARYALHAARSLHVPLVVTMQGELSMDATGLYQRSAQTRRAWRQLIEAADVITGCSQFVVDEAAAFYGRSFPAPSYAVSNGIDVARCRSARPERQERPYLLGLGRLVPQKGYDLLIDAFAGIADEFPEHDLLLAGDGPERGALEERVVLRGLAQRVRFTGAVNHDGALSLFAGAAAFVLASRHEPQGIVVLEAMGTATPVVAAAVGGVPEIVKDGINGLLFQGGSPTSLAERLRQVLTMPRDSLTENATRTAEDHDWRIIADRYDEIYAEATSRFDKRRSAK